MATLATIQSAANVASSRTFVTKDLFDEESLKTLRNELKASKNGKYSRTLGCFVEEKACTLEKAKSYSVKTSINKMKGTKTSTLFCNADDVDTILKAHPTAVTTKPDPSDPSKEIGLTVQDCLNKAAQDV
jgi:phage tail sheath gpL-like